MKNLCLFSLRLLIPFFIWIPLVLANPVASEVLPIPDLITALKSGGYILYMRHGPTEHDQKDSDRDNLENCTNQRNLSTEGREQAKRIGHVIRALDIPLGDVLSSPYCRCKDTASLAFGQFKIEPDLQFSISKDKAESQQLGERLYTMMMNSETGQKNAVFVGHSSNLKDGLGIWPKPEGVIVVFQKHLNALIYKGMITPDAWPDL